MEKKTIAIFTNCNGNWSMSTAGLSGVFVVTDIEQTLRNFAAIEAPEDTVQFEYINDLNGHSLEYVLDELELDLVYDTFCMVGSTRTRTHAVYDTEAGFLFAAVEFRVRSDLDWIV